MRMVGSAMVTAVETEFDRVYAELFARLKAEYGEPTEPLFDESKLRMPASFHGFIRGIERLGDRVKVEVGGRLYWIIYDDNPRWEEIAA
jgi:hypothetical protein